MHGESETIMSLPKALVSSETQNWTTPDEFWIPLDKEFNFVLDVAAQKENTKCLEYLTIEDDALKHPWKKTNWCNPPYGDRKYPVKSWVAKAYEESVIGNTTVMLLPINKMDQQWFHDLALKNAEIRIVKGRVHFVDALTKKRPTKLNKKGKLVKDGNSQGSMLIIFRPNAKRGTVTSYDWKTIWKIGRAAMAPVC